MPGTWTVSSSARRFSAETKRNLRDLYAKQCAICGQHRESPFGRLEAEAAHVHPAQHGGPDRETNGLLLCQSCHWGFDSGWLSLNDEHRILVADADAAPGADYYQQFDGRSLCSPRAEDLEPEPRFLQVHRKLFGFDAIVSGDRLTIGGLINGETELVDGRRVVIEGSTDRALLVNCRVEHVGSQQIRCAHQHTLQQRSETAAAPEPETDSPFDLQADGFSFETLEQYVLEIQTEYSGVEQKWEWGRLFRMARTTYGYSHEQIADELAVTGASASQVERAERVYDMFPDRDYDPDGPSFSAIAELQRVFPQTDDTRAAYDCIVAAGVSVSTWEARAWVELLKSDTPVTPDTVRQSLYASKMNSDAEIRSGHVRRILDVHAKYESTYGE